MIQALKLGYRKAAKFILPHVIFPITKDMLRYAVETNSRSTVLAFREKFASNTPASILCLAAGKSEDLFRGLLTFPHESLSGVV
jgi:hypothetical protein